MSGRGRPHEPASKEKGSNEGYDRKTHFFSIVQEASKKLVVISRGSKA